MSAAFFVLPVLSKLSERLMMVWSYRRRSDGRLGIELDDLVVRPAG